MLVTRKQVLGLLLESSKQYALLWRGEGMSEAFKDELMNQMCWRRVSWKALCMGRDFPHSSLLLKLSSLALLPYEQLVGGQSVP